jgi:hypothetical protein
MAATAIIIGGNVRASMLSPTRQITGASSRDHFAVPLIFVLRCRHHHLNTSDFVALGRYRNSADRNVSRWDIHQLVPILEIIMKMFLVVGIEIRLQGIDRDLSEKTNLGELMKRVVDSRE